MCPHRCPCFQFRRNPPIYPANTDHSTDRRNVQKSYHLPLTLNSPPTCPSNADHTGATRSDKSAPPPRPPPVARCLSSRGGHHPRASRLLSPPSRTTAAPSKRPAAAAEQPDSSNHRQAIFNRSGAFETINGGQSGANTALRFKAPRRKRRVSLLPPPSAVRGAAGTRKGEDKWEIWKRDRINTIILISTNISPSFCKG